MVALRTGPKPCCRSPPACDFAHRGGVVADGFSRSRQSQAAGRASRRFSLEGTARTRVVNTQRALRLGRNRIGRAVRMGPWPSWWGGRAPPTTRPRRPPFRRGAPAPPGRWSAGGRCPNRQRHGPASDVLPAPVHVPGDSRRRSSPATTADVVVDAVRDADMGHQATHPSSATSNRSVVGDRRSDPAGHRPSEPLGLALVVPPQHRHRLVRRLALPGLAPDLRAGPPRVHPAASLVAHDAGRRRILHLDDQVEEKGAVAVMQDDLLYRFRLRTFAMAAEGRAALLTLPSGSHHFGS
jgi:hypothetical protein